MACAGLPQAPSRNPRRHQNGLMTTRMTIATISKVGTSLTLAIEDVVPCVGILCERFLPGDRFAVKCTHCEHQCQFYQKPAIHVKTISPGKQCARNPCHQHRRCHDDPDQPVFHGFEGFRALGPDLGIGVVHEQDAGDKISPPSKKSPP